MHKSWYTLKLALGLCSRARTGVGAYILFVVAKPFIGSCDENNFPLQLLSDHSEERIDIADRVEMERVFKQHQPQRVVNLAAQAGVRYSLENPHAYIDANVVGFTNILEGCACHSSARIRLIQLLVWNLL